ncbi:hypothetical protein B0T21DRAFT_346128 [Apiosordaria backusii]|uniref:Uncharacterized protein n=1 Tax=Apiosordaria backusii TaxID=314023 RepID=A0AA40EN23_9PEZI|nr:hypothetical protein B0T21DRAFT_346128 [Apiosordaria backusii]
MFASFVRLVYGFYEPTERREENADDDSSVLILETGIACENAKTNIDCCEPQLKIYQYAARDSAAVILNRYSPITSPTSFRSKLVGRPSHALAPPYGYTLAEICNLSAQSYPVHVSTWNLGSRLLESFKLRHELFEVNVFRRAWAQRWSIDWIASCLLAVAHNGYLAEFSGEISDANRPSGWKLLPLPRGTAPALRPSAFQSTSAVQGLDDHKAEAQFKAVALACLETDAKRKVELGLWGKREIAPLGDALNLRAV